MSAAYTETLKRVFLLGRPSRGEVRSRLYTHKKTARESHGPQDMVRGGREGGWVGGRRGQWDRRFFAGSVQGSQLSSVETQSRFYFPLAPMRRNAVVIFIPAQGCLRQGSAPSAFMRLWKRR